MNEPEATQPPPDPPPQAPEPPAEAQPFFATLQGVWERIKHHKIVQWTLAYLAVAYTLLHGAEMVTGSLGWPHGWVRLFALLLILGVPIVITLAWYHGCRGQQRASGTEVMIIALLIALGGAFLWRDSTRHEDVAETVAVATPAPAVALPEILVAPDDKSIAVLPFVDMSAEKNQEYMSDGIAEELLNLLAQVPDLKVIARTSSFSFKGEDIPVSEIAKQLNVAHVLEGSVRTFGDRLRITAQLVRTADSTHLWSERYDRPMDDVFAVQDEIANAIVQALQIKLHGGTLTRREGGTSNLEAYRHYLRAWSEMNRNTQSSLDAADASLKTALVLDPNYGMAWDLLGAISVTRADNGFVPALEGYENAREYTLHALELSPNLAGAHASLGSIYMAFDWDWVAAEAEFEKAFAIDPSDLLALNEAGRLANALGQWEKSQRLYRAALARDPLDPFIKWNLANTRYLAGDFAEAEAIFRQVLSTSPTFAWTRPFLGKTLVLLGRPEEALRYIEHEPSEIQRLLYLPVALHALGRHKESDEALRTQMSVLGDTAAVYVAQNHAYRGNKDGAMEWLERGYQQKDPGLIEIVGEPLLKNLADDPRYKAFLRKLKLPET